MLQILPNDYLSLYWFLCVLLLAPMLRGNRAFTPILIYFWVYAAYISQFPFISPLPNAIRISIDKDANFILLMTAAFACLVKTKIDNEKLKRFLGYVCVFNLVLTCITTPFREEFISGIVPNKGMNGILNCFLFPFVFSLNRGWLKNFALIVILPLTILSRSSCAWGSFTALVLSWGALTLWSNTINKKRAFINCSILVVLILGISFAVGSYAIPNLLDDVRRFKMYRFYYDQMAGIDWLIGKGPGSFSTLGIFIQHVQKFIVHEGYILFLHSDPLQFVWEYGLLGLVPLAWLMYHIVKYGEVAAKVSAVVILTGGLFYYPFHFPVHLFFIFMILKVLANNVEYGKA